MGQDISALNGAGKKNNKKNGKPKYEPPPEYKNLRLKGNKKKKNGNKNDLDLPKILPNTRCRLKKLRMERVKDHLLLEQEFITNKEQMDAKNSNDLNGQDTGDLELDEIEAIAKNSKGKVNEELLKLESIRGSPVYIGTLEEMVDDDHAIITSPTTADYYVSILSFVDKDLLEPGATVLLHHKTMAIVGVLQDNADATVNALKIDKSPLETYQDIGGLEQQIQEIKEAVELPLTHPELYEEMGIKPPKGVILYGAPGTGKTLLAKAVANQTSATFLRIVGSELIQKYLGDGPRLVRQIFKAAAENAPSIVFIDEIDAIGTKRYDSNSGGEREIQRTMLELLNQLDGFDDRGDIKVIMATNKIESLDPALIRPGRIDRKILFENPDLNTKKKILQIHTSKMTLAEDVTLDDIVTSKDDLSGADIKALCTEAGLLALRERRMQVTKQDFESAKERVLKNKVEENLEGLYV